MSESFVNKQISVSKTGKSLVEFCDNIRFQEKSAWPLDKGARIMCRMNDYSQGTGNKLVSVHHNILVTDIKKILTKINQLEMVKAVLSASNQKPPETSIVFSEDKILNFDVYANPDNPAQRKVTQINISYNAAMNNPYCISVANGWGIPEKTSTGGTKVKKDSMRITNSVKMFLTYDGIFTLLKRVDMFVDSAMNYGVKKYIETTLTKE